MDSIEKCEKVLKELYKFSGDVAFLGNPIEDNRLENFEESIKYAFPEDFKYILKKHNSISLFGTEVLGLGIEFKDSSLDKVYNFEHFVVSNKMPPHFLPFSPDGRGNHYCLDLSKYKDGITPIVFWQSDFIYESYNEVEVCNDNFIEWIEEVMIEWGLDDYNYDGSEK